MKHIYIYICAFLQLSIPSSPPFMSSHKFMVISPTQASKTKLIPAFALCLSVFLQH